MTFKNLLIEQSKLHQYIQPQDIFKLCYQVAFGAEHIINDLDSTKKYLLDEFNNVQPDNKLIYEQISENYCRINLSSWKKEGLLIDWLFNIFILSSKLDNKSKTFEFYIEESELLVKQNIFNFTYDDWDLFKNQYFKSGIQSLHHSKLYTEYEKPSYRLVNTNYLSLIPILKKINKTNYIIAIDGRCASGKTTISNTLKDVINAEVIQMDDFFLPPYLVSDNRLNEIGGNIHYERFINEVINNLRTNKEFKYQIYDCKTQSFSGFKTIKNNKHIIIEGSYSCHPIFKNYMDLSIFFDIKYDLQLKRIETRNGVVMLQDFINKWIPLEENYIKEFNIDKKACLKY